MKRYPGIRPFRTDEQALFFGRDADIERLFRLLELEQLVILYGKSGYGKSSLLSAGIFPLLEKQNKRRFWEIRFGPYKPGESLPPAEVVRHALARHAAPAPLVADALAGPGIWQAVKNCQRPDQAAFLLVFDQFEELFSYPPEQVLEFKKQLAEALYAKVPRRVEAALARAPLSPDAEDALYTPFDLKVVFSIRADRMSLLNGLKDYLPNLLQHGYELDALDEASAREAVCRPAALSNAEFGMRNAEFSVSAGKKDSAFHIPHSEFDTPPFSYAPETLAAIFDALRDAHGRIETSALQIICRYVEENLVVAPGQCIGTADLSDIPSIFGQFYYRTIANLPKAEQTLARRLVEDQLVKDGLRVPYAAQALLAQPGITQDLLDRLSAASLLRVQRDEVGRMIYEVGHDTLVGPIGEIATARRAEEERERLQQEANEQRLEKEKAVLARRRARLVALGAVILSLVAIGASWYAYLQTQNASRQAQVILETKEQVESSQKVIKNKSIEAARLLQRAERNEAQTLLINEEVQRLQGATEVEKRRAAEALQQAQEERRRAEDATVKVVQSLFDDASAAILRLDYETARDRLHDAADLTALKPFDTPLGRLRPVVADFMFEPAYFFAETGNALGAMFEVGIIARSLGVHDPADTLKIDTRTAEGARSARSALRTILQNLRPAVFQTLEEKYYPVMLSVPGGTFHMAENYQVLLSDYQMARTETTVWQYNLYLAEQGKDIFDEKTISQPGWGWEGNNPIVNVTWFDACLYANWLSRRFGLRPVYMMGAVSKGNFADYYENIAIDIAANGFRLPTEAEWEFVARGGGAGLRDGFEYSGGDTVTMLSWYNDNSRRRTRAVAKKLPNQLGLYDMGGNVWEWCWDWYEDYQENGGAQFNPTGPKEGERRVNRGGSWNSSSDDCRLAVRSYWRPDGCDLNLGFRLASSPQ